MAPAKTVTQQERAIGSNSVAVGPLSAGELQAMDAYWRASNYLSVGQI